LPIAIKHISGLTGREEELLIAMTVVRALHSGGKAVPVFSITPKR
jgi:hypothetical protein